MGNTQTVQQDDRRSHYDTKLRHYADILEVESFHEEAEGMATALEIYGRMKAHYTDIFKCETIQETMEYIVYYDDLLDKLKSVRAKYQLERYDGETDPIKELEARRDQLNADLKTLIRVEGMLNQTNVKGPINPL